MRVVVLLAEKPEVYLEVKRLHKAALHLWLACVVADRDERPLRGVAEYLLHLCVGSASRVYPHAGACLYESGHERLQASLVAHAHEDVPDLDPVVDFGYDVERHGV